MVALTVLVIPVVIVNGGSGTGDCGGDSEGSNSGADNSDYSGGSGERKQLIVILILVVTRVVEGSAGDGRPGDCVNGRYW